MTGKFFRHQTREEFLIGLWNKRDIRTMRRLVREVKKAEKSGTLVVKRDKDKPYESYEKNIRWYMGKLQRERKIKGFLGPVGRPSLESKKKKRKKKTKKS